MKRYLAACFDLDGVLVDTMPLHAKAWKQAGQSMGIAVPKSFVYEREGEPGRVTARLLLSKRALVSEKTVVALLRRKEYLFRQMVSRIRVNRTLKTLVCRLSGLGVPLGLVTGTSQKELRRMVPRHFLGLFRIIITGDRVRHGKPHPEPYRTAFRGLGIPPKQVVVIENAPYGIQSAQKARAGLVIALASSLPSAFLRQADVIVSSPSELDRFLRRVLPHKC